MPTLSPIARLAAVLALLSPAPALAVDAVSGALLVMRVGPGDEHPMRAEVPPDSRMRVHGCIEADHWCLVHFGGRLGWVDGLQLEMAGLSRPPARSAPPAQPAFHPGPVPPGLLVPVLVPPFAPVTAEEVIVGMGERFGYAAGYRVAPGQKVVIAQPRGGPLVIKPPRAKHRFAGHPLKPRFKKAAPAARSFRAHLGKPAFATHRFKGRLAKPVTAPHRFKARIGVPGFRPHVAKPGKAAIGRKAAKGRSGLAARRAAPVAVGGLPVRGGWRP